MTELPTLTKKDFTSDQEVRWCPGCGDYAILATMQGLLPKLGIAPENTVFVSGIGCSSRFPYYMNTYGFHTIHGRAPAIASGLAAARPDLNVFVVTGDGDALSIGGNHLIHALRRNINLTILLFNNEIYGLTKGQYSPTSPVGTHTKSTPMGSIDWPLNPISLGLGAEASFVARTIDTDRKHLQEVIIRAFEHRGSSLVEILQNCVVFNDDAFLPLTDPTTRAINQIRLVEGKPIVFGPDGENSVCQRPDGGIEIVPTAAAGDRVLVHSPRRGDPSLAFSLSRLIPNGSGKGPTPIGVFREVDRPVYEDLMSIQLDQAVATKGRGDLSVLLGSGATWDVD